MLCCLIFRSPHIERGLRDMGILKATSLQVNIFKLSFDCHFDTHFLILLSAFRSTGGTGWCI